MAVTTQSRYRDVDFKMRKNPVNGDVLTLDDTASIRQSLQTLFKTRYYDRPMQPHIGSWLQGILFKQNDDISKDLLRQDILDTCRKYEPRVQILTLDFEDPIKERVHRDEVIVKIGYLIVNTDIVDSVNLVLSRSR